MTDTLDTSLYATEKKVTKAVGDAAITHDNNLRQVIANVSEEARVRKAGDDHLTGELGKLQEGFDDAILAAQEGADNIEIELQSYMQKEEANSSFLQLEGGTVVGEININRPAGSRALTVKKDGDWQLKIWADGTIETKKTGFTDVQFVTRGFTDDRYLGLAGGTLTGTLSGKLIKSTRDSGFAFEVKPGDTTLANIHTEGHASFSQYVKVDGKKVSLEDHTHDYAAPGHNHDTKYVKGNWTISKSGGNWYIS